MILCGSSKLSSGHILDRHPRFRLAIYTTHCAPHPRTERFFRRAAVHRSTRRNSRAQSRSASFFPAALLGLRRRCAAADPARSRARRACARHLLWLAVHHSSTRRQGAPGSTSANTATPRYRSSIAATPLFDGIARADQRLDVARRRSRRAAARLSTCGEDLPTRSPASPTPERRIWAVQFHPEVHHTKQGTADAAATLSSTSAGPRLTGRPSTLSNPRWMRSAQKVGDGHAICALSGGVDSSVAAVLVHRAIGERLTCVFVNNGVLRKNEFFKVQDESSRASSDSTSSPSMPANASSPNSPALPILRPSARSSATNSSPSSMTRRSASRKETGGVDWLVQGTLYPDVIESSSVKGPSQTIKSHHNVGGLPETHEAQAH